MYELFFILLNTMISILIDFILVYFLYFHWWSFLSIPFNDYDMQVLAQIFYHDYNGLLWLIAFYFWSILYWLSVIYARLNFLFFYLLYFLQWKLSSFTIFIQLQQDISLTTIGKYTVHDLHYFRLHSIIRQEVRWFLQQVIHLTNPDSRYIL